MLARISRHNALLAALAGACIVLAFIPFYVFPLIFVFPVFLNLLSLETRGFKWGFFYGFLTSFVVNAGGFYWVVYTIHEFGYLPWVVSALLYLAFCGFGALNFPLFTGVATFLHERIRFAEKPAWLTALWFTLGLPALFTLPEYFIPKLFPFYAGHCLYWLPVLTQVSELTGSIFLSFAAYSLGGNLTLLWLHRRKGWRFHPLAALVPALLVLFWVGFGAKRLAEPPPPGKTLRVALIQPNIGSLEKVAARRGLITKVRYVMERYHNLTTQALASTPKPELVLWPETAMPFQLTHGLIYAQEVRDWVTAWGVPLITGAYAPHETDPGRDYNAAFLLSPEQGKLRMDIYRKNILLAFGEYFPFGEYYPKLYQYFPQVSNFGRGTDQNPVTLADGTRLGVTICYEAIVPSFFRKVVRNRVNGVVNLTNDSWFGPTSEPRHHGALAVFRTVETRVPLLRVTNTGTSFAVDTFGRMSDTTGVYQEGVLVTDVLIPRDPPETLYTAWGDWFILFCAALAAVLTGLILRKKNVPLPL